ncbi:MAG: PAS domain S-box protein [Opitutaceae bacterium]|nr:PAS domain S-box protein [Opitutaceae bacterium]
MLVLNSYHPGYNWSDGEQSALLRTLVQGRPDVLPSVEYLDWRRFPNPARVPGLLAQLEQKYDRVPFDLIIALDDPAVTLVLEHRDYFGAAVPLVFGGLNDVEPEVLRQFPAVTGVAQTYDFAGTLKLIQRLQPEVRKIAAVHCRTESGLASRRALEKVIERNAPPFAFEWVEGWTAESLLQRVSALPDDTAVLILSIFRDEAGRVLVDDAEFGRDVAARCRVPVYFVAPPLTAHFNGSSWETAAWQGMGGSLLSEELHGELVARLALRVLGGEAAGSIPIVTESPSRLAFDYRQLQRFGIPESVLPAGVELFHAPQTFYQINRVRIIAALVVIAGLGFTVVLLVVVIVQRRRAELALRRSHAHFELIARATNDAVWDWEPGTGTMWWNDGYARQLQLPSEMPASLAAWEGHLHPDDRPWLLAALRERLGAGGEHWSVEYRVVRTDGEVRHVLDRVFVERPAGGQAVRVLGARLDLTDRKRAEQERLRLAAAVEQSPEAIFLLEADGAITYANPAFERATGFAAPATLREAFQLLCPAGPPPLSLEQLKEQVAKTGHWVARIEGTRRDGTGCVLHVVVSSIRGTQGGIVSYVLVGQDVTRESKLEDQVRLSQKMEAVGLLAGGIAHDFNNLLQAINGFTSLAQDAETAEERTECLAQVRAAAGRAAQLTRQLLVFSREEKGELVDLNLDELLDGQMKLLRRLLDAQIEVVLRPAPAPCNIRGDRGQLEQVFMNLCINARDAMPRGGRITIELEEVRFDEAYCLAHPWARPGHYMQVAVTDTGSGMDRATLGRIFDPFFTTKPKDKGTGLGLAIVYGIVQKHEGLLHVYSEVGVGSSFRLYFPVRTRDRVAEVPVAAAAPARGSGTVLLAEDDEQVRKLALRILGRAGYDVVACDDGEQTLRTYLERGGAFDLVILDAILPKLTGREVFEQIRARDPHKPVLFCSGYSEGTIQPEFSPGQEVQLLAKPYNPNELLRRVAALLEKGGG